MTDDTKRWGDVGAWDPSKPTDEVRVLCRMSRWTIVSPDLLMLSGVLVTISDRQCAQARNLQAIIRHLNGEESKR